MLLARRLALPLIVCFTLLAAAGGCSRDIHVFRSTANSPKNVAVISDTTGETLWSLNVPEGQQLRLDFDRGGSDNEAYRSPNIPAKTMRWDLYTLDATAVWGQKMRGGERLDGGKVDLPAQPTIMSMTLREPADAAGR